MTHENHDWFQDGIVHQSYDPLSKDSQPYKSEEDDASQEGHQPEELSEDLAVHRIQAWLQIQSHEVGDDLSANLIRQSGNTLLINGL